MSEWLQAVVLPCLAAAAAALSSPCPSALLRALLQSPGRVLSLEQLRDSLYGYSLDVESNAVNVHVHHLRRKLGSDMVETVRGVGFRLGRVQGGGR